MGEKKKRLPIGVEDFEEIRTEGFYYVDKTDFIREADSGTMKREIERLVAGEVIEKEIHQELTYRDMYDSIENIWSVLYMTGYLTRRGKMREDRVPLAIPNVEIRKIFTEQIMVLFKENVKKDGSALEVGCREALAQIGQNRYEEELREEGTERILKYGIACYKKRCKVVLQ